jgi:hypothetical protein
VESLTVVTEPLLHPDFVQFEIVVPILERLRDKYDITVASPRIAPLVRSELESRGLGVADGGAFLPPIQRSRDEIPSFVGSWARDAMLGWNRRDIERVLGAQDGMRMNVSMTTAIDSDLWLIQSRPLYQGLEAMRTGVKGSLRVAMTAVSPVVGWLDLHHLIDAAHRARARYSTTRHVGDWFAAQGLPVEGVIPMYYRPSMNPSTSNPSRDYLLVYLGKETDATAVRSLLRTGLPVKLFGSKSAGWVLSALKLDQYPNARMLGRVTDEELRDLYTNARFTAFPFTEEPFGLVPLESMACGTPILTYGMQGPAESVVDNQTGWLVQNAEAFLGRAVELWNDGVPSPWMVNQCLARARAYHVDTIAALWKSMIGTASQRRSENVAIPKPHPLSFPEHVGGDRPAVGELATETRTRQAN